MTPEAWIAIAIVIVVFVLLALGRHAPYLILLGGLTAALVSGIAQPGALLSGFSNPAVATVAVLFVVAAGLRQTGALAYLMQRALGQPRSATRAVARLIAPVAGGSAFINNTAVVAMLMPAVMDWCKRAGIAPSRVLLPLSYLAILGGLCTVIGTSTNLVLNGLLAAYGMPEFRLFEITWVGLPCAVVGTVFLLVAARRLLPEHRHDPTIPSDPREYTVEMTVAATGPLVGKSIREAGLRHLPGLYLMEIHRNAHILPAVGPQERLEADDQLVFVGVVDSVVDVQRLPGLLPATRQVFKLDAHRAERCFVEAVVSRTFPLRGQTIRESGFRNRYNAVVLAVSRDGERVPGRIGDIELKAGDAMLLEALPSFVENNRNSRDFYLVSRLDGAGPPTTAEAPRALMILGAMVLLAVTGTLTMLQAAFLAAAAMLILRCCSQETVRRSIDWPLLLAIGASFGLGKALEHTGAAEALGKGLLSHTGSSPWLALFVIYGTTTILSELVTNNAAAVIVFPIAMSAAAALGASPAPFVAAMMIAASASFATPLGYQTNLMVYGPGGYQLRDFLKVGLPMNAIMWTVTCLLTPLFWPF